LIVLVLALCVENKLTLPSFVEFCRD